MKVNLLRDPKARNLLISISVLFLSMSALNFYSWSLILDSFKAEMVELESSVVTDDYMDSGEPSSFPSMQTIIDTHSPYLIGAMAIPPLFFGLTFILIFRFMVWSYAKIESYTQGLQMVLNGEDHDPKLDDGGQGSISRLGAVLNLMSSALINSIDTIKEEKNFLKDMISDMAHQLRAPLSELKVNNEMMIKNVPGNEELWKCLIKSQMEIVRIERFLDNILGMARIEVGAIELNLETSRLHQIVSSVIEEKAVDRKIILSTEDEDIALDCDGHLLSVAINNCIENSIEHTDPGGVIEVTIRKTDTVIEIIVMDDGEGITPEDLPHIFKKFHRGNNSQRAGLGLTIVKGIVESHGGLISAESTMDQGTTITMIFPMGDT
jgi:signal transduction histidine kinase